MKRGREVSHSAWILEVFQDNTPLTMTSCHLLVNSSRREWKLPKNILLQSNWFSRSNPWFCYICQQIPWSLVSLLSELGKCQGINYKYFSIIRCNLKEAANYATLKKKPFKLHFNNFVCNLIEQSSFLVILYQTV